MADRSIMSCETVTLDDERHALVIIDQTALPGETRMLALTTQTQIWNAIRTLQVRGAPAIGVAAAIGLYLAAQGIRADDSRDFAAQLRKAKDHLASARPTAVNLFWALDRMEGVALDSLSLPLPQIVQRMHDEAVRIKEEDVSVCRRIGEHGLALLKDGDGVLTHCNAGQLATARYGTALAPLHIGHERGYRFKVYADETRPLLQGARLTAYELQADGIDVTLICDNMASQVMKNGWVQAVLVGCDRVAANGDAANKIGTSGVAILAKHYGVPFYVCAPTSTIDMSAATGADIPIEERPDTEVTELWYRQRMAPQGVKVYNPAFDVTGHELITAFVTEHGVIRPPFDTAFAALIGKRDA